MKGRKLLVGILQLVKIVIVLLIIVLVLSCAVTKPSLMEATKSGDIAQARSSVEAGPEAPEQQSESI